MLPGVFRVMTDTAAAMFDDAAPDDGMVDDVQFSEDEEAALLVALLRWRGPDHRPRGPEAA
ncbi:MAG: hypothetical protein JWN67_397 [Actinomycetia bacterium]|nr:hypothetical protein [Actinomycetes bacterium]